MKYNFILAGRMLWAQFGKAVPKGTTLSTRVLESFEEHVRASKLSELELKRKPFPMEGFGIIVGGCH